MTEKIRIGAVKYLNTRPLVHGMNQGLGADRIDLSYAVPAVLADQMSAGELDVALMPVIELARMPELEIVPGLGIVTEGETRSVLLISNCDFDRIGSVALDVESRTSNALTRVLLAETWGLRPRVETAPAASVAEALSTCDAVVRIGDKALFDPVPEGLQVLDLGGAWTQATGLPFVFAAWIARPGVIDREIYRVLHESRRRGSKVTDELADAYTWEGRHCAATARDYLRHNIRFRLGAREIEAMKLFFALSAAHGVIDEAPTIRLTFGNDSACRTAVSPALGTGRAIDEAPHA
jgi:chorismate dehydratase